MKRVLMSGTALAAATMLVAGGAVAADKPSISVNGYYEGVVGGIVDDSQETKYSYAGDDVDGTAGAGVTAFDDTAPRAKRDDKADTSALDTRTDAEIHFNGRASTDNGLKYHMRVELEGQNNHSQAIGRGSGLVGDPIDEYFLSVSGAFGQIILGGTGGAPVKMLTGLSGTWATGVGRNHNFYSHSWVGSAAGNHYGLQHARLDTGDGEKVTYISPKLGGFQVGLSYVPRKVNHDDNVRPNADTEVHDGFELAANYTGKFGDVGFGVGGGMTSYQGCNGPSYNTDGTVNCKDTGESDWLVAGRIDFGGGFRLAAAHKRVTNENEMMESSLTDVGVRFIQGANSFSLGVSHGEMENTDAQYTGVIAAYARALGPGVKWHANLIWNDSQSAKAPTGDRFQADGTPQTSDTADALVESSQSENSGTALVTGIKVTF